MSLAVHKVDANEFKLVEYADDPPNDNSTVLKTTHIQHKVLQGDKGDKLEISFSLDRIQWKQVKFDYEEFRRKITSHLEGMVAQKLAKGSFPLTWLGKEDYEIMNVARIYLGYNDVVLVFGQAELSWEKEVWAILDQFTDSFWNEHKIEVSFKFEYPGREFMQVEIIYTDDVGEQVKKIAALKKDYEALLLNAKEVFGKLKSGESSELVSHYDGWEWPFLFREVWEEVRKEGADIVRENGKMYLKKLDLEGFEWMQLEEKEEDKKEKESIIQTKEVFEFLVGLLNHIAK